MNPIEIIRDGLIVSCQAPPDSPLHEPSAIAVMARASVARGAVGVRIDTPEHVRAVREKIQLPIIGLWKQQIPGYEVYITPQFEHAEAIAHAGADIIAIDATLRERPGGETVAELIRRIHDRLDKLVMADVDTIEAATEAAAAGADLIGSTLYGYTNATNHLSPPGFELLSQMVKQLNIPIICEGGIASPQMAQKALKLGSHAVVVGTDITGIDYKVKAYREAILTTRLKPMHAPNQIYALKELFAEEPTNVIDRISPNDEMYHDNQKHYFGVGESALRNVKLAMLAAMKTDCHRILDLPCGHGRVLRMLKAAFPKADLVACDLNRDGVDFCSETFGATPIYSVQQPEEIPIQGQFDLIWCGSLLTHVDSDRWASFLNLFNSLLAPSGILIFTVHGHWVAHLIRHQLINYGLDRQQLPTLLDDYKQNGFAYQDYPNQSNYGHSVSSPAWVLSQLAALPTLRLLTYTERGWDNHQDVVACLRIEE